MNKSYTLLLCGLFGLFVAFVTLRNRPILMHVFPETGCACGEYHDEVTGFVIRNPLRDRAPERSASKFLAELREGRCSRPQFLQTRLDCDYALNGHRVSEWKLVTRSDKNTEVSLYFKLTKLDADTDPRRRLTGEGLVKLVPSQFGWVVVDYSSYF